MRLPTIAIAVTVWLFCAAQAFAQSNQPVVPLLPQQFGGWHLSGQERTSKDAMAADPVNAAVLQEYGFSDFASGTYTNDDGHKLRLKAARFADASGAYGAFTFYKLPQMLVEKIGDQAGSLNERILFYRGNILIDAVFERLTAMSAAELRELSGDLTLSRGNTQNLPGLPAYLPKQSYVKNSAKYVIGPAALEKLSAPIPAQLVGFNSGAEVVLGDYNTSGGQAVLTLISYPTPQIAADHLRQIQAAQQPNPLPGGTSSLSNLGAVFAKRTGPIVVVATGPLSSSEGKALLASVNYDADVTWNENTYFDKKNNIGTLIWNAFLLSAILVGFALVAGLAFGGVRVLVRRILPEKVFHQEERVEFISLHLAEKGPEPE